MDVLVLGGSVFLGRAVVAQAQALGGAVTVFNRGLSGSAPPGVTQLLGDRTDAEALGQLRGRSFDLVVDTCGYVPAQVRDSAALLAPTCRHYVFVSTVNVYPGWPEQADYHVGGVHDGDPDATRSDVPDGVDAGQEYGWLKSGCEVAVQRAFGPQRCTVLRGGAIVGPYDSIIGRLPWWIERVARGGEVLTPGDPDAPVSLIDARDLARFALSGVAGTYEAAGPHRDTRADLMDACRDATGAEATFTYIDEDWLLAQGVAAWTEMPLWAPAATAPGVFAHDTAAAEAAGLHWRPLIETVADTWAWQRSVADGWRPGQRTPGLEAVREARLLATWHER